MAQPSYTTDLTTIADAVLDEPLSDHTSAGTVGEGFAKLLGLTLENHVEDDITRDGDGNKTESYIYLYDSAANATTHDKSTGLTATYKVTASYSGGRVTQLKVIEQ